MTDNEALIGGELNAEELLAALPLIADHLEAAGDAYLLRGKGKAARALWRRLLLPNYYIKSGLMKKKADSLRQLSTAGDADLDTVKKYFESLDGSEKYLLEIMLREATANFDALASLGERIFQDRSLHPISRSKLLRNYGTFMGACNLLPEPSATPDWRTPNRIAYVAASSLPYSVAGYTTRTEGVALGYMALGIDLQVVTRPPFPLNIRKDLTDNDVPDVETHNGVVYHRLKAPHQRGSSHLEYVMHAADTMTAKIKEIAPECVIAGSNHINALPALIAARRLGLPFTYEVRGFWEVSRLAREPEFADTIEYTVSKELEAFVAKNSEHVLTLTTQMRDELANRGVAQDKIGLMPNGVAGDFVGSLPSDPTLAEKLELPKDCPVIGYIGSILEYEGLQDLAHACIGLAKKGVDFRLLLVGQEKARPGEGTPITDEIQGIFRDAGISERLIMPGRVPFSEVEHYYSLIDIAPIPRRPYEVSHMVSPIKPLEAMAKAKAVIVSDVGALSDMVEDGVTGMVFRAGDASHLEEQLSLLISDRNFIARLQKAGQDYVKSNRTWQSICSTAAKSLNLDPKP